MAAQESTNPIKSAPLSPINILAGGQLNTRNPITEPPRANNKKAKNVFPEK